MVVRVKMKLIYDMQQLLALFHTVVDGRDSVNLRVKNSERQLTMNAL